MTRLEYLRATCIFWTNEYTRFKDRGLTKDASKYQKGLKIANKDLEEAEEKEKERKELEEGLNDICAGGGCVI